MKLLRVLILTALCGFSFPLSAQVNVGVGYNLSFMSMGDMDFISDKYNEYFELFNQMDKVRFPRGEEIRVTYRMTDLVLEAGWTARRARATAKSGGGGAVSRQDVRVSASSLHAGIGYILSESETFSADLGISGDLGFIGTFSRRGQEPGINNARFGRVFRATSGGATLWVDFTFKGEGAIAFSLRPYFQYYLGSIDLSSLHASINQPAVQVEGYQNLSGTPHNAGLVASLKLDLSKLGR